MIDPANRRQFLRSAAIGGVAWSAADWAFLGTLPRVSAADVVSNRVQFTPEIEPLVRLIEESPREQVLERVASIIRKGTPYRDILAALQLTGIRNVQPRPVGFKFHSVLVVNSCHLASVAGPEDERWLPIFWALDYVKQTQNEEASKTGWKMPPVNEAKVPHGADAAKLFTEAMESWDAAKADVATAGIVRSLKKDEVFELFARYAARDFRDIGHKAIFLANAWRTLEVIGYEHAEPVLRSLAFAMMDVGGDPNPAKNDLPADRPWKQNAELVSKRPAGGSRNDAAATNELISGIRIGNGHEAAKNAVEILSAGVSAGSVWDGVFVSAGELLMRQPGIVALHGLTTANAVHYIAGQVKDETLRQRLLLQACSFNTLFRDAAQGRGKLARLAVSDVAPLGGVSGGPFTIDEIFADVSSDKLRAARKLYSHLSSGGDSKAVLDAARRLVFQKGSNSHDYKFSSAILEDFAHVSPEFRNQFLALAVFNLKGTSDKDSPLIGRTRAALQA